ncbi:MAG: hypothetical protein LBG06_04165 [Deltaproteobacteria bacterium]|nr:hypothetical protein [Deltaproteobacteria bacterium]
MNASTALTASGEAPPAAAHGRGSFRRAAGALGLWAAAFLAAFALCSFEATVDGVKTVDKPGQLDNLLLTASAADALASGQLPPRVSGTLLGGLGLPVHQFYSPLFHVVAALSAFVLGGLFGGYAAAAVLFTAFGFVFAWRLSRYVTSSRVCAAAGAFLWVAAPYLVADRGLMGDLAEYAAGCLLPMALYFNYRAVSSKRFRLWACAALSDCALLLTHLVTGFHFYLFSGFFALACLACAAAGGRLRDRRFRRNFAMKTALALSAALSGLVLGLFYLGPQILYGDLILKAMLAGSGPMTRFDVMTQPLVLLSLTNIPWFQVGPPSPERFQAGALLLAGAAVFAWRNFRGHPSPGARALVLTAALILFSTMNSVLFTGPAAFLAVGRYSFRFILILDLAALVMAVYALKQVLSEWGGDRGPAGITLAVSIAGAALALAGPYLSPLSHRPPFPLRLTATDLAGQDGLARGEKELLRVPPAPGSPDWVPDTARIVEGRGGPSEWAFRVDLAVAARQAGGGGAPPPGELLLDFLYYPGLQDIEILIEGRPARPGLGTFWQTRPGPADGGEGWPFHGLRITGLPETGLLEVKARFRGYAACNYASLAAALALCAAGIARSRKGPPAGGSRPALPGAPAPA